MSKYNPQGDVIMVEKIDYNEEVTTGSGIIYKRSQTLSSNFAEAKIIAMGSGLPLMNGDIPSVDYSVGDTIVFDVRGRVGIHDDFDVIKRNDVIAVVN